MTIKFVWEFGMLVGRRMGRPTLEAASALKERLLESALSMLCRNGIHGLSMDALAQEAGVTKRTIYRHYESKNVLIEAVANRELARLEAAMVPADDMPSNPLARLESWSRNLFRYAIDASTHKFMTFLRFEQLLDQDLAARLQKWTVRAITPAAELIAEAQRCRELGRGDPLLLALLLIDLLQGPGIRMNYNYPTESVMGGLPEDAFFAARWAAFLKLVAYDPWTDALLDAQSRNGA